MSDMLQLVVVIREGLFTIVSDKLKHIGHKATKVDPLVRYEGKRFPIGDRRLPIGQQSEVAWHKGSEQSEIKNQKLAIGNRQSEISIWTPY